MDQEKITARFNETGFPFQAWCLQTIRTLHTQGGREYRALSEHPFTHPSTNGPLLGVHGTLDILALTKEEDEDRSLIFLAIETKRAKKEIKNWVFTSDKRDKGPAFVFCQKTTEGQEQHAFHPNLSFPGLGYFQKSDYNYCTQAIEVNEEMTLVNRNQDDKVYKALKQVVHGVRAIESGKKIIHGLINERLYSNFDSFYFVPVVITTANLWIAQFKIEDVAGGDIPKDKAKYISKPWLTYDFPLPDYLDYPPDNLVKRTIFIVNADSLVEFLNKVALIQK